MGGQLPTHLTTFIGRERELAELRRLLAHSRLLTLTGVGGGGKTRLAVELAGRVAARYPGGVWFVDLAPHTDPGLVPRAVASACGVIERDPASLLDAIAGRLRSGPSLILLDNCEHLLDAAAAVVDRLLRECEGLTVLATSREALNLPGEVSWRVPPLSLPSGRARGEAALRSDAVRLFVDRAVASDPDFALDARTTDLVVQVCERLDGLPLALELAAMRLRAVPLEEIVRRLEDRFRLLARGPRAALARHQTLRATIDWSYQLLDERERRVFRHLAVFAGSFDEEAVQSVTAEPHVADVLARLVEKSLLVVSAGRSGVRYRLLETLREYAAERRDEPEAAAAERAHVAHFIALAERADAAGMGPEQTRWLDRVADDHDNLRAALERATDEERLQLANALGLFWFVRGYPSEGRAWLERALAGRATRDRLRASALRWAGTLSRIQTDYRVSRAYLEESRSIAEELGDRDGIAAAIDRLGSVLDADGDHAGARAAYARSLAIFEELGDRWGIGISHFKLGVQGVFELKLATARAEIERALIDVRAVGDSFYIAQCTLVLGLITALQDDRVAAHAAIEEGLRLSMAIDNRFGLPIGIDAAAILAVKEGRHERALRLAGASAAIRRLLGVHMSPWYIAPGARQIERARAHLGPRAADAGFARGQALDLAEAVAFALAEQPDRRATAGALTRREWEIAQLVAQGTTNREIAAQLRLSERTVEGHVERIRGKLAFRSRAQIAAWVAAGAPTE